MKKDGIQIGTIALANRRIKIDFRKIFEVVVKTGIMAATGSWASAAKEFAGVIGAFKERPEVKEIAWFFILEALVNTVHQLVDENQWRLRRDLKDADKLYDSADYVAFLDGITGQLMDKEIIIGPAFLKDPKELEVLSDFKNYFKEALLLFGLPLNEAEQISHRLPTYFVFEVNNTWRRNVAVYEELSKKLKTPFSEAVDKELQWQAYRTFLDKQIDLPVFEEAFGLRDIFIPLRAYYEDKEGKIGRYGHTEATLKSTKKRAVWIEESLNEWLAYKKTKDEVKMISGGPGSGKSSLVKMWAAKVSQLPDWKVLFIPLHLFDIHGNIIESIGKYLVDTPSIPFKHNPLEGASGNDKFVIIFDGLDELVKQGKTANDSANELIDALEKTCGRFNNSDTTILKILIAGRPISVQYADSQLRGSKQQVIYLLPYYLTEGEMISYPDTNKILTTDQRQTWWKKYQELQDWEGTAMPDELQSKTLDKLTCEPLLNYLIALSWSFEPEKFGKNTNINDIYYILIKGVYKRDYEQGRNVNIGSLNEDEFFQILEEIAVCAWHGGDVRVTSERKIEQHIKNRGMQPLLEDYKKSVKEGVSRLLTAFYFRKYGKDESSEYKDETFEFTHKSFGEYLTGRALVEMVQQMYDEIEAYKNNQNRRKTVGWTLQQALEEWLRVAGATLIDDDLKDIVRNEIKLRASSVGKDKIRQWQLSLGELIAEVSETGMPFNGKRVTQKREKELAQNAEIGLLILLESCALVTQKSSAINWAKKESAWNWYHGLTNNFNQFARVVTSLNFIELKHTDLKFANLQHALLHRANLQHALLYHANLQGAILYYANLQHTDLQSAKLQSANLQSANLQHAKLQSANLQHANLQHANLQYANLQHANLQHANLQHANLQHAEKLTLSQLLNVETLYKCIGLPISLEEKLKKVSPNLFELPMV